MKTADTATRLLDAAQQLIEDRGYNAFSYKDLAESVGIRTASIHYHFPTKSDLGKALIARYTDQLGGALAEIDSTVKSPKARLEAFFGLYHATEARQSICLCGSLAADHTTLSSEVQTAIEAYLGESETWVAGTIRSGVAGGEFSTSEAPAELAAHLIASLQGGLILARARSGPPLVSLVESAFFRTLDPG